MSEQPFTLPLVCVTLAHSEWPSHRTPVARTQVLVALQLLRPGILGQSYSKAGSKPVGCST